MIYNKSDNKFNIIIFDKRRIETYLELINQNLILIRNLIANKEVNPNDPSKPEFFFIPRAKYLQIMTLIGLTSEHLIKIVLLKRGVCINIVGYQNIKNGTKINKSPMISFSENCFKKISNFNEENNFQYLNKKELDKIYLIAKQDIKSNNLLFSPEIYNLSECIKKFIETNKLSRINYLSSIQKYPLSKKYLGFNNINKKNCFEVIRASRNRYVHLAEPNSECQGIYWYMYNYLIFVLKIEFPSRFKNRRYIGSNKFVKTYFK